MAAARSHSDQAIYVISVAAELAGVHPQTLRVYERKGLLRPERTQGNTRRYSERDVELLRKIQRLSHQGVNLAGITRILQLERELEDLKDKHKRAIDDLERIEAEVNDYVSGRSKLSLVPLRDVRRVRRAMKTDAIERAGRRRVFTVGPVDEGK